VARGPVFVIEAERYEKEDRVEALYRNWQTMEQERFRVGHWNQHLNVGWPHTKIGN